MNTLTLTVPSRFESFAVETANDECGGATVWQAYGTWTAHDGTIEREPIAVVMVSGAPDELGRVIGRVGRYLQAHGESAMYCDIAGRGHVFSLAGYIHEPADLPTCASDAWQRYADEFLEGTS